MNLLVGVQYPFLINSSTGAFRRSVGLVEVVESSLRNLFDTQYGDGVHVFDMRNGVLYGTRISNAIMEPENSAAALIKNHIANAAVWESRVRLLECIVKPSDFDRKIYVVTIRVMVDAIDYSFTIDWRTQ